MTSTTGSAELPNVTLTNTYDTHGRITNLTDIDGSTDFNYDNKDQLIGADRDTADTRGDENYTYDENGNRTLTGYSTGNNNRLLSDGTYNYEYDAEGNRTRKTTIATGDYVTYTWDHRNRLTQVSFFTSGDVLTKSVEYAYDLFDRRIIKNVDDDGDLTIDREYAYLYDQLIDCCTLDNVILVFDGAGNQLSRNFYGAGTDSVLAIEEPNGDVIWALEDHLGTVRDWVERDSRAGVVSIVNHILYDSFEGVPDTVTPSIKMHQFCY